jgi:hypothetical protein
VIRTVSKYFFNFFIDQQMLWDFVCEKIVAGEVENIASSADIASIEVVADENKELVSEGYYSISIF